MAETAPERPAKRFGSPVVVADEALDGLSKHTGAGEVAVLEQLPLQDGEPQLDLVDPGGVLWCVDEREPSAVPAVEARPPLVFSVVVSVEVVPDHDDAFVGVPIRHCLHERDQVLGCPLVVHPCEDLAAADVQGGDQGLGSMTDVLKLSTLLFSETRKMRREPSLKCLDARLLVDAQYDGIVRRPEVEFTDPGDLGLELRVRAVQPPTKTMRFDLDAGQSTADFAATHRPASLLLHDLQQRVLRPHCPRQAERPRVCAGEHANVHASWNRHRRRAPSTWLIVQRGGGGRCRKPVSPPTDSTDVSTNTLRNRRIVHALGCKQHHLCPYSLALLRCPALDDSLQFLAHWWCQAHAARLWTWHAWFRSQKRIVVNPDRTFETHH